MTKRIQTAATAFAESGYVPRPLNRLLGARTPADYAEEITFCLFAFSVTKNGAFLWRAYEHAREAGIPVPDVVLGYLDDCAFAVRTGSRDSMITGGMLLRHPGGGAGALKRAHAAQRQMYILVNLLTEYRNVRAGTVPSKVEARRIVARRFRTTEGRVHQLELRAGL